MPAFPDGVQTVTVTAPANGYRTLDGDYQEGTITLTPSVREVVSAEHGIIAVGEVNFTIGASGAFPDRDVLPNDAEGFLPVGWTYRLDQLLSGEKARTYNVSIPASAGTVDLSTLVEVEASDGTIVYVPGGGGHGTPSDTVVDETDYGQAATAGVATAYSRGDHTHGTPDLPPTGTTSGTYAAGDDARFTQVNGIAVTGAPSSGQVLTATGTAAASWQTPTPGVSPAGTVTAETAYEQASSAGAAATYSRGDHTHGTPALPTAADVGALAASGDQLFSGELSFVDRIPVLPGFDAAFANQAVRKALLDSQIATRKAKEPWVFDVTDSTYEAVGDGQVVADGAMTSGSTTLTCATANFQPGDVGKAISVKGAAATGVTTLITTITARVSATQVTLGASNASGGNLTGAVVIWGTDDTAAIQAAVDAAEAYLAAGHTYARVYFPPRAYIVAGPLSNAKSGNGQITFGVYPTTGNKPILEFCGEGDGAAAVRHWEQTVPQHSGSCLISLGVFSSTTAQTNNINADGNPGVISGPTEGHTYGVAAKFSNIIPGLKNLAILTTHSSFGLTYGAFNFYGCANAFLENVGWSTAGVVPGSDYTSPGVFATGLSIGGLLPAPGNNDLVMVKNVSIGGGYTYGIFCTEHLVCDRIMVLYCWSAICLVGTYAGSVGSVHAMLIESASVEACINELYVVGAGSGGVGPIVDVLQFSTESSTPNLAGNSQTAVNSALGRVKLTGIFSEAGVSTQYPTGIEFVDGQVPRAIKRKTGAFTCSPIDRTLVCDTTSAGFTGTLPDAAFCPVEYVFKNVGSNTLTVATTSSQLIYTSSGTGATTASVATGQTLRVQALFNGTSWGWYAV